MGKVNIPAVVILSVLLAASLIFTIMGLTALLQGCGLGFIYFIPGALLTILFSILLAVIVKRGKRKGMIEEQIEAQAEKPITDY
ncbi:MAG TPA: hypothetical protein VMZ29_16425 [Candidatus Bathyarchaeia archaeon]|nr:hypothetical protein [Candidatus Bathyarchaeia archaeon]